MKKYRVLFSKDGEKMHFAATLSREPGAESGDCFVRAITEEGKIPEKIYGMAVYATEPMYLIDLWRYIIANKKLVNNFGRCMGLSLEDEEERKIKLSPISLDY